MTEPHASNDRSAMSDHTPYARLGEAGVRKLVNAFYDIMDRSPAANDIRAMHATDLGPIRSRLTAYLITWMGGPPVYIALQGSMCLTDAHAQFHIGPKAAAQWLLCMQQAMQEIGVDDDLKAMLEPAFRRVVSAVQNQHTDNVDKPADHQIIARG